MSKDTDDLPEAASQAFLKHLEGTGFFNQITDLEKSLKSIVNEIQTFNETSNQRQQESENLAAHILAVESLLSVVLQKVDVKEQELVEEIHRQSKALTGEPATNPTVEAIALDLLRKARGN